MNQEELHAKYGEAEVIVLPETEIAYVPLKGPFFRDEDIDFCMQKAIPMKRYLAENDPSFKQVISYAILQRWETKETFVTRRLAGDSRLKGQCSIGIGGHMEGNETLFEAAFRELREEVGLAPEDAVTARRIGYILDNSSPVNSVHLGIVWHMYIAPNVDISVKETEKLAGWWASEDEMLALYKGGQLESWSNFVYKALLKGAK